MTLAVLVLSEDGGDLESKTVAKVVSKLVTVRGERGEPTIAFEPSEDRVVHEALSGNAWLSRRADHDVKLVALVRLIAEYIASDRVVLFHYDGDVPWSKRAMAERPAQFAARVQSRVRSLLEARFSGDELSGKLANLVEVVPHYSIEAWAYQAIDEAIALCRKHHRGEHVREFTAWMQHRAAIDELVKPKQALALRSDHNGHLAERLTTKDVIETVAADASLAELVRRLVASPLLKPYVREALIASTP